MKTILKCLTTFVIAFICITTSLHNVSADGQSAKVHFKAVYSNNITATQGDTFLIQYKFKDGTNTAEMQLDANSISNQEGIIDVPAGEYEITSIEYTGSNEQITQEGYAITKKFITKNTSDCYIYIAVGYEAASSLVKNYADILEKPGTSQSTDIETGSNQGIPSTVDENGSDFQTENTETNNQENTQHAIEGESPSIEYYNNPSESGETSNKIRSILTKIIPVTIIFLIGIGVVYVFHKKGKF